MSLRILKFSSVERFKYLNPFKKTELKLNKLKGGKNGKSYCKKCC